MFSIALLGVAVVIVAEGGLALVGLECPATIGVVGERSSRPGRATCSRRRGSCFAPSFFIFVTVLSLNYLGDVVRARFDVRGSVL